MDIKQISVATLASVVSSVSVILGSAFYIDARYVHAEDIPQYEQKYANQIKQVIHENRINSLTLRKQLIEDKLFEYESKRNRNSYDNAMINRYNREIQLINSQLNTK
jgi:hypothetical protein